VDRPAELFQDRPGDALADIDRDRQVDWERLIRELDDLLSRAVVEQLEIGRHQSCNGAAPLTDGAGRSFARTTKTERHL
jgi:hypothetical protein